VFAVHEEAMRTVCNNWLQCPLDMFYK